MPAYLNALAGSGVHVLTTTDYLARRDFDCMAPVYGFLGLRAGLIVSRPELELAARRAAYSADVTYGIYTGFGYDYLRDNLAWSLDERVQRGYHFAIADEADLILIDEARTPLIISGPSGQPAGGYAAWTGIAARMRHGVHYEIDGKRQDLTITGEGMTWAGDLFGADLTAPANAASARQLRNAHKAREIYRKDRDYVVRDGQILPIDKAAGITRDRHRYEKGMHQALEAKEGLPVQAETMVLAAATVRDYLGLYGRLGAMTGTAVTDADTYRQVYGLDVVPLPAITPVRRINHPDAVYPTEHAKLNALADEAAARHAAGQSVLIGAVPVEQSQQISRLLAERGVPHEVLNATGHDREAPIIARSARAGAVTVATTMAGRGVPIALGGGTQAEHDAVAELGGLCVLGAQRHQTRRLDLRLQDLAGRRGDPGEVKFFISYEDDTLLRLLGLQQVGYLRRLGGEAGRAGMVMKLIEQNQGKADQDYASWLVQMLRPDQILSEQREVIYNSRRAALEGADLGEQTRRMVSEVIGNHVMAATLERQGVAGLWAQLRKLYPITLTVGELAAERGCSIAALPPGFIAERISADARQAYDHREAELTTPVMRELERRLTLAVTDRAWRGHLQVTGELRENLDDARNGPELARYQQEASRQFNAMLGKIKEEITGMLFNLQIDLPDAPHT